MGISGIVNGAQEHVVHSARSARHSWAHMTRLQPTDRAEKISFSDRHAAMTQDVIRRGYKEEEIRQGELLQIVNAFHLPVVAASGPCDDLVLRAVELCAS